MEFVTPTRKVAATSTTAAGINPVSLIILITSATVGMPLAEVVFCAFAMAKQLSADSAVRVQIMMLCICCSQAELGLYVQNQDERRPDVYRRSRTGVRYVHYYMESHPKQWKLGRRSPYSSLERRDGVRARVWSTSTAVSVGFAVR